MGQGKITKCRRFEVHYMNVSAEIQEWLRDMALAGYEFCHSNVAGDYILVFVKEI